jgi:hypothetical protein
LCQRVYERRVLGYPEDILNGFAGIMNQLKIFKNIGDRWSFGLPEKRFMEALLWIPEEKAVFYRRVGTKYTGDVDIKNFLRGNDDYKVISYILTIFSQVGHGLAGVGRSPMSVIMVLVGRIGPRAIITLTSLP